MQNGVLCRGKRVPAQITCFAIRRTASVVDPARRNHEITVWRVEMKNAVIVPLADRPFSQTIFRGRIPHGDTQRSDRTVSQSVSIGLSNLLQLHISNFILLKSTKGFFIIFVFKRSVLIEFQYTI